MTSSGVPWRYRYQYLSAGVNTGSGWETWNTPTGQFATYYMDDSSANGYLPVFSYYEMLQSNPSTGTNESDRDFNNVNNTSTMNAYYGNFKLLMQKAGAFGKTVVVHVEPDFWGYMQQRAGGGDASTVTASVASSGFADVAGLPNTVQGFGQALVKLRDSNATNVVLGIHASMWSSGFDVATDTSSTLNAVAEADKTAAFLNSAGAWDVVFNDVDDHDAGWWEQQGVTSHWWDTTNTKFPNFNRYVSWLGELHGKTGKPQVVWQVPVGNQYYLTMNNTCGHYQDNVGAYFLNHTTDLYSAGLIAILFGAGNACQTTYTDARADGITNNNGVPTTDTPGFCNACNTHTSTYSDDDGGYLRVFVGLYYTGATSGATSLGGILSSSPAASSWGTSRLDVFVRGSDNSLFQKTWNGTSWSGWTGLGGILTSSPDAVSWGSNRLDLFVRGSDNQLYHKSSDGSTWSNWEALGGVLTSGPGVASWASGRLDIFVRGTDNALWHKWWDNTTGWSGWENLGGILTSDPAAVSWGTNRVDIFVRGTDNGLWQRSWNGTSWSSWISLSGTLTSGPAASSCASGHLDVFALGSDQAVYQRGFNGAWGAWQRLGGPWTSDPGAVCPTGSTKVDLFERGGDNALWEFQATGS
jgi:hypothetical protein